MATYESTPVAHVHIERWSVCKDARDARMPGQHNFDAQPRICERSEPATPSETIRQAIKNIRQAVQNSRQAKHDKNDNNISTKSSKQKPETTQKTTHLRL